MSNIKDVCCKLVSARENEGTEREAQDVSRDMPCPRKLFLDERMCLFWRKSVVRDVRMQSCLALKFLVKRENGGARGRLMNIYIHNVFSKYTRTSRKTDFRWNKDFRSSKNNFRGHDISQGLDRELPSLSPHFLLVSVKWSVKWSMASLMSSKLEPVIWLRVLVTLAYMKGRTDVRTLYVRTFMTSWL